MDWRALSSDSIVDISEAMDESVSFFVVLVCGVGVGGCFTPVILGRDSPGSCRCCREECRR